MRVPDRPNGWPRWRRLRRASDFRRAFRAGLRVERPCFSLVVVRAQEPGNGRLGFAVSRRIGGAVQRNRVKRRLREAFRLLSGLDVDLVVLPRPNVEPTLGQVRDAVLAGARRALLAKRTQHHRGTRSPTGR